MRNHVVAALAVACAAIDAAAAPMDLYEWVAVAPVVGVAELRDDRGKYAEIEVTEFLRGEAPAGTRAWLDLKGANREREEGRRTLRLEEGQAYLVLLRHETNRKSDGRAVFALVRGIDGVRELPAEGAPAILDAVRRFVALQDRKNEVALWTSLREMLEETNPVVLESALGMFLKFRRGDLQLLPLLRPLLDHPRPDLRAKTALLIGQIVERRPESEIPDDIGILAALYGLARRDPSTEVRAASTAAVGGISGAGAEEVLREIARSDPEQSVRYEAEKILFERNESRRPKAQGDGSAPRGRGR
jgi:hypothetical protein